MIVFLKGKSRSLKQGSILSVLLVSKDFYICNPFNSFVNHMIYMYNLMHTTTRYTVCMELAQKLSGKALTLTVQEMQETWVRSLHQEDPLGEEVATPSGTLAWKIPWTEEPGGLQSMGSESQTQLKQLSMA